MVMDLSSKDNLLEGKAKWTTDALEALKLTFIHNINDLESAPRYQPGFVYQHFGENETIFGYEDLEVTVNYTDVSLYIYPEVRYKLKYKGDEDLKADDIVQLLKEQLPNDQLNMLVESKAEFHNHLIKQKAFKPFGELIRKYEGNGQKFEVFKITEGSPEFDAYLARAQTLALWYIEAAQYTDQSDEAWMHYFVYEVCDNGEGDGSKYRKFAGYSSIYRYYAYPDKIRPKIAQLLLLPKYRSAGNGARLLQSIYQDLWATPKVLDIAVEDPGDLFQLLRDYVDCMNCLSLTEFSPQHLKEGFTENMRIAAKEKFKIIKTQARRVYEILRYRSLNKNDEAEVKAYRLNVKNRIYAPQKKSEKDWKRMHAALDKEEALKAAASEIEIFEHLAKEYEAHVEIYQKVVDRLEKYPSIY
ncbi:unnamed protein product [Caenorhabditis bovis]|uniref:Histone acetyltransferase type B catalytic subunit n=1 Tax=Caenorhabditis bovis TaxID=2654633 RepID=A0A8S1EHI5_9PELO|nr:unnamed protein product [Caenorhabditis bovis]